MNERKSVMDELNKILPTFQPNALPNDVGNFDDFHTSRPDNYIVLTYSHRMASERNSLCSFSYWKVQVYVGADSIIPIDEYGAQVRRLLKSLDYEVTYAETGDYYDPTLARHRMEIEYRIPQGGII